MNPRSRTRPVPRLYILTPPVSGPDSVPGELAQALRAAGAAAVLLRLADADERGLINMVKRIAPMVQDTGAALLLDGRPEIVARPGGRGGPPGRPGAPQDA